MNATSATIHVLQQASQGGIILVFLINSMWSLLGLLIFCCCIRRLKLFSDHKNTEQVPTKTEDKTIVNELDAAKRQAKMGCCARIIQWCFYEREYQDFATDYGHEAAVYLFFVKQIILVMAICCFLGISVLLPLHLTGTIPTTKVDFAYGGYKLAERDNFLLRTTVTMIASDPMKLIAHVILPICFVLVLLLFLHRFVQSKLVQTYYNTDQRAETMVSNFTIRLFGLPRSLTSEGMIKDAVEKLMPGQVVSVRVVLDTTVRVKLQHEYDHARNNLDHYCTYEYKYNVRAKERLCTPKDCCTKVDAIEYYAKQKANVENKIDAWTHMYSKESESTGHVFVIFKTIEAAREFLHLSMQGAFPNSLDLDFGDKVISAKVYRAHEPVDIEWENMNIKPAERAMRVLAVFVIMLVIMLFFTTPLALFNTVQQIVSAAVVKNPTVHSTVQTLKSVSGNIGDIVFQYVPTFVLFVISFVAPGIIMLLTDFEGHQSQSAKLRMNMLRLYAYVVLSSLILPTLVLTSVDGVIKYAERESLIDALQDMFLPASGAFFLNYALQYLLLGNTWDLMRLRDVIAYLWKSRSAITKRAQQEALQVAEFDIASEYGYTISFFGIILTYSTFSPMILIIGLLHFIVKYAIDRHNITVLCDKNAKGQHRFASDFQSYQQKTMLVLQLMGINIVIFEVFMILYFLKAGPQCHIHLITMLFVFTFTLLYILYWTSTLKLSADESKANTIDMHDPGVLYSPLIKEDDDDMVIDKEAASTSVFSSATFAKAYYPPFYFEEERDTKLLGLVDDVEADQITKSVLSKSNINVTPTYADKVVEQEVVVEVVVASEVPQQ